MTRIRSTVVSRAGVALVCAWLLSAALPAAASALAPRLVLEATPSGLQRLAVEVDRGDARPERHQLRETAGVVRLGPAGADPRGRAAFVTWSEGGAQRWFATSRDGGRTWSQARSTDMELRLHDGHAAPGRALPAVAPALALPRDGRLFLVQLRTLGLPEWRESLREAGAEVLSFFPDNAHVVRADPALASTLRELEFVERVEPYHPAYRIETGLRQWLLHGLDRAPRRVRVVTLEPGREVKRRVAETARRVGARLEALGGEDHLLELWATPAQLQRLAAHDDVQWIDLWTPPGDDMDLVRQDSGAEWLEANTGVCGTGVRGEVLDSGIQQNHQDFDGILMHTAADVQSHGTSTYGIVFGNGNRDGDGNAQATGHMPSSTGCPSQGIFADYGFLGDRFTHTHQLKQAPYFASFQSNSWGDSLTTAYTSVSQQMDYIIWQLDIAITQSQSNAGSQSSRPQAWAKNIVSVGGIRHYGTLTTADDAWAGGASIGPAADGRIKPDVSYWYDGIYTTTSGGTSSYTTSFGGTSAATPEVAGVLGLMVQMWSDNVWGTNPQGTTVFERQPHASTIKALLINNARQYPFSGTTHDLTRTHQGWGRPNAQAAKERAARSFVVDESVSLALGQTVSYPITVAAGESELKVTLVYRDPPGTTSATLHRINDLSLKVTSPSAAVYHGNGGLLAGNYSTAGGAPNTIDTVENVFVASPQAGTWTVEVSAAEINQDADLRTRQIDDATFALVVTGGVRETPVQEGGAHEQTPE
jgi:hypothetical protein